MSEVIVKAYLSSQSLLTILVFIAFCLVGIATLLFLWLKPEGVVWTNVTWAGLGVSLFLSYIHHVTYKISDADPLTRMYG